MTSLKSVVVEEEEDAERDAAKVEKREREKGRDFDGHPPPIPEKVSFYIFTAHYLEWEIILDQQHIC